MFDKGKVGVRPPDRESLPAGLADMPPGPVLAQVLASVDRSRLNGYELVVLLQARNRQLSYDQAQMYADMAEIAHCPDGDESSEPDSAGVGAEPSGR